MKKITLASIYCLMLFTESAIAAGISGEGASFPASIYKVWGKNFKQKSGLDFSYEPSGSGNGIKQIQAKAVDFGASDKPLKPEELDKAGLLQFPTVVGGVVPVINVAGIESGTLKLDGPLLADIFLGKITKWNDPAIVALNPGIELPNENIAVVHRSDGSGTTFILTNYLSKVSAEWKATMGEGTLVPWRVGSGCKTNLLIPVCMYQINNSIGYMDYAYAAKVGMNMVQMKNRAGQFITPGGTAFQEAAKHESWEQASRFYEILTDEPGAASWPIVGATFILMHKVQDKPETAREVLKFFSMAYSHEGDTDASELGYVPLPNKLKDQIRQVWATEFKDAKGNLLCKDGCGVPAPAPAAP
ncbi:MAG TPA: phosphate ABC transporter substrate-binding protein PstS [Gallionellaceae bacterium]